MPPRAGAPGTMLSHSFPCTHSFTPERPLPGGFSSLLCTHGETEAQSQDGTRSPVWLCWPFL